MSKQLSLWSPRPDAQTLETIAPDIILHGLPVINIVNTLEQSSSAEINAIASTINQLDALIFVSHHAVQCAISVFSRELLTNKTLIAIGKRTEATLSTHRLSPTLTAPAPYNSEALIRDNAFQNLTFQRVGIICGKGGRTLLQKHLQQTRAFVTRIPCYQRDKIHLLPEVMVEFINNHAVGGILLTSKEITDAVTDNLSRAAQWQAFDLPVFALSERIATHANQLGFRQLIVASQANRHSLYQSIINWWSVTK